MAKKIIVFISISIFMIFLSSCPDTGMQGDITTGLVAYYPFNGNADDESGNGGPSGVIDGASLTAQRDGDTNKAISFDGVNDMITFEQDQFTTTNELSVAFWINVTGSTGGPTYFVQCSDFGLLQNGMNIGLAISIAETNSAYTPVTPDLWHLITGTYDGTSISIYLNGALMETVTHAGTISDPDFNLTFGYFNTTYWAGKIDDFRIYDRVLTTDDMRALLDFED